MRARYFIDGHWLDADLVAPAHIADIVVTGDSVVARGNRVIAGQVVIE